MSGVTFERLPPERQIAAPAAASAGSCCCCCCCCLHTVGSLVGALTAKAPKPPEAVPTAVVGTDKVQPSFKVTKEYWVTLLIISTVALPLYVFFFVEDEHIEPLEWMLVYALVLPGLQLLTSIVVAIRNAGSVRPGRDERLRHLGSITGRAFLGGVLGIIVMIPLFALLLR